MADTIPFNPLEIFANRENRRSSFPSRLMAILNNNQYRGVIEWIPSGDGFMISDKKRCVREVLMRHFGLSKYESFTRRLNRWNFIFHNKGNKTALYFHPLFLRRSPELCLKMRPKPQKNYNRKKKTTGSRSASPASVDAKPDAVKQETEEKVTLPPCLPNGLMPDTSNGSMPNQAGNFTGSYQQGMMMPSNMVSPQQQGFNNQMAMNNGAMMMPNQCYSNGMNGMNNMMMPNQCYSNGMNGMNNMQMPMGSPQANQGFGYTMNVMSNGQNPQQFFPQQQMMANMNNPQMQGGNMNPMGYNMMNQGQMGYNMMNQAQMGFNQGQMGYMMNQNQGQVECNANQGCQQ
ncbi:hypothetical protein CTEN210_14364 [Chaetoceros tenuissimus]|uniref:HSF-type DNA-binding domain-containing protein n=1 Tax=Chaetoceros tenuissimus TaxID=426638 RepID=A0AAD3HCB6_9STRA|nr:hypothetical protein CTEN210_14364 [Chaetoceros tenuissimus]